MIKPTKAKLAMRILGALLIGGAGAAIATAQAPADKSDEKPSNDHGPSLENAPPVVLRTVPQAGVANVDPALAEIRVTYSKEMTDHSWSWSTWGENSSPKTTGKPHYLDDKRTCVLPVKLQPGHFYAFWLNSDNFGGFRDKGGRKAVPYLLVFKTRP